MIVVDTNVIAYFILPGPHSLLAHRAAEKARWCAPLLWRAEFCSILALYIRRHLFGLRTALEHLAEAERLMWDREHSVRSSKVLEAVERSNRSAYDCHFIALAMDLGLKLVTMDEPVVLEFPSVAVHLRDFVAA